METIFQKINWYYFFLDLPVLNKVDEISEIFVNIHKYQKIRYL